MGDLMASEIAELWGMTFQRVQSHCKEGWIEGVINKGIWLIPKDGKKPIDSRKESKNN